ECPAAVAPKGRSAESGPYLSDRYSAKDVLNLGRRVHRRLSASSRVYFSVYSHRTEPPLRSNFQAIAGTRWPFPFPPGEFPRTTWRKLTTPLNRHQSVTGEATLRGPAS